MNFWKRKKDKENQNNATPVGWETLSEWSQWEAIKNESFEKPQVIFKHSSTCGISRMVLSRFEHSEAERLTTAGARLIEVRQQRELSLRIASDTGVVHQSPQVLLVQDGVVVKHASHGGILDEIWL